MGKTIGQLVSSAPASAIADADYIEIEQSAVSKGGTFAQVWTWLTGKHLWYSTAGGGNDGNLGQPPSPKPSAISSGLPGAIGIVNYLASSASVITPTASDTWVFLVTTYGTTSIGNYGIVSGSASPIATTSQPNTTILWYRES
jgi:hypothetical protein